MSNIWLMAVSDLCQTLLPIQTYSPLKRKQIPPLRLQRFKPDFQSGIYLHRIGCFQVNVSSQNLNFMKTVCKHILYYLTLPAISLNQF